MRKALLLIIMAFALYSCEKESGTCRCTDGNTGITEEHESNSSDDCNDLSRRAYQNGYPLKCTFIP